MEIVLDKLKDLSHLLSTIQISDVADILIVTFLVYRLLLMIRSTSTSRIAKAIVVLLVASGLTSVLHLNMMNFFLDKVLEIGFLALVILFQPELRRIMERMGGQSIRELLGTKNKPTELDHVIAQTVAACEVMSREKVGALIVFERSNRLDEYFKTGTVIDGRVSEQLLRNIFFPKAALHDGALVIRDGRVAATGCVLPLSANDHLSSDLGTRHRAGVGVSEATDAVVVIVSEETGTISVAVGGMLKRHLAPQTLEKLLRNELATSGTEEGKGVRKLVSRIRGKERKNAKE